jgi:potassium/hydrogen antiporter
VDAPFTAKRQPLLEYVPAVKARNDLVQVSVPSDSPAVGQRVLDLRFPSGSLIVLIIRSEETIVPIGGTVIEANDVLLLLADKEELAGIQAIITPDHPA